MMDYIAPRPLAIIRKITRQNAIDGRLEPVDRHMQRWAESQGSGVPAEPEDVDHLASKFKLTPLPPEDAVVTDQIVLEMPDNWHTLIALWYRSPMPVDQIALELGMKRRALYHERLLVLAYLFGRLTAAGVRLPSYRIG